MSDNNNYEKIFIPVYKHTGMNYKFNQDRNKFYGDLVFGQLTEEHFANIMSNSSVEVKHDMLAQKTGNIYIEYECSGRPSGVMSSGSDWYAIFLSDTKFLMVLKEELVDIVNNFKDKTRSGGDRGVSVGVCIPMQDLMMYKYKRPLEVVVDLKLIKPNGIRKPDPNIKKYSNGKVDLIVNKKEKPHIKLIGGIYHGLDRIGILDGGINFYNDEFIFKKNMDYKLLGKWKYVYENPYITACLDKDSEAHNEVSNLDMSNCYLGMNSIHKIYLDFIREDDEYIARMTMIKVDITSMVKGR